MDKTDWLLLNALYTYKSMAKAADSLFLSQPAVSYRMNRMEHEFGQVLFSRTNRGVRLTSAGLRLHSFSGLMLQYDSYIYNQIHQDNISLTGTVTLGTTSNFLIHFLSRQLKVFHELYPGIQFHLRTEASKVLTEKMMAKELMIAIIRGKHSWFGPSVELFDEPLIIISSEPITDELLHTKPLLFNYVHSPVIDSIDQWISEYFGDSPPIPAPIQLYGDSAAIQSLVREGFGWSVISSTRLNENDKLYSKPIYHPDGSMFHYKTRLIYSEECENFDTYKAYIAHITEYFENRKIKEGCS